MKPVSISIHKDLLAALPNLKLGCITATVAYAQTSSILNHELDEIVINIEKSYTIDGISKLEQIHQTREAYKKLGKKPSRYRPSAEALYRRILKQLGIYRINNIVDTTNIISLKTQYSIGTYDINKIKSHIVAGIGKDNESYSGIRKEEINLHNLPLLRDINGAFGNPCSDSHRTMIDENTHEILMILWAFNCTDIPELNKDISFASERLIDLCGAKELHTWVI